MEQGFIRSQMIMENAWEVSNLLFAPMYKKYSLDFVSFGFYSNIQIV